MESLTRSRPGSYGRNVRRVPPNRSLQLFLFSFFFKKKREGARPVHFRYRRRRTELLTTSPAKEPRTPLSASLLARSPPAITIVHFTDFCSGSTCHAKAENDRPASKSEKPSAARPLERRTTGRPAPLFFFFLGRRVPPPSPLCVRALALPLPPILASALLSGS